MTLRRLSPGGYEYLTGSVACADRELEASETLADYYLAHGYPPGRWFGSGAAELELSGPVTAAQMNALFGEGRHPHADVIEAELLTAGASPEVALRATKLGRRFPRYGGVDELRGTIRAAYIQHNRARQRPDDAPIDETTRARIRHRAQTDLFTRQHGRTPRDDTELARWLADQQRQLKTAVAGYELVFAPPKSVSLAWALGDAHTRERIMSIHRQAVTDALSYLENNAAFTRQGSHGQAQVDTFGITAALFEHYDSRAGDPHLHTHVPIAAKVKRATDGTWTTLDSRTLHAAAVTVSEYYNSRIRDLTRDHGAVWRLRPQHGIDLKRPVWELTEVPGELLTGFARRAQHVERERSRLIVAHRATHGREPTAKELHVLSRRAQYGTRDAKQVPTSLAEHVARWHADAASMVDTKTLARLGERVFSDTERTAEAVDIPALATATRAVVSDSFAHFTRWNLEAEAHRQTAAHKLGPGARDEVVASVVDAILRAPDTLALRGPAPVVEPAELRRSDGESVFSEHRAQRYTTERTLRNEAALVDWARGTGGHRLTVETVERATRTAQLNEGQRLLVTEFARSGRLVHLALAPAGTGKTTAMRVFSSAWRSAGGRVYALGPSARAAHELGDAINATPHTLHQITTALRHGRAEREFDFDRGDVLVIDEAAMSGTHTLHDVVEYAVGRGAVVRLVGDDKQLGAVEAGGAIRLLDHDVGAVRFTQVMRFTDPAQADASLHIRDGNAAGLDYYFQLGWVRGGSRETMRDTAHHAWRHDLDTSRETLLIVPANEDVVALNSEARALRQHRGAVDTGRAVPLHDTTHAGVGDWIVTRRNNRLLSVHGGKDWVKNGDTWHVRAVGQDGALDVTHRAHGGRTRLPADYVARYVELAYAATLHRTQGMTARDSTHQLVPPELTREQLYSGITRAQGSNRLYVVTHHHVADSHRETPPEKEARAVLFGILKHTTPDTSATEELRDALHEAESLATLVSRHTYLAQYHAEARHEQLLEQHAPATLDQPGTAELLRVLQHAEDRGWQAERLLPTMATRGGHDSDGNAPDPADALRARLRRHMLTTEPPARAIEPDPAQLRRWHSLMTAIAPEVDVNHDAWNLVWRHAAAGAADGLNADSALARTAHFLAERPADGETPHRVAAHREAAEHLVTQLAAQRDHGTGTQPALPWMARPHPTVLAAHPEFADLLTSLNEAAANRLGELRVETARTQPEWTAHLGPRPHGQESAQRWDHLAGLAAAYRETHGVTTTSPSQPLGPAPDDSTSIQGRAWHSITEEWRPVMTTPSPYEQSEPSEQHDFTRNLHDILNDPLAPTRHEDPTQHDTLHRTDHDDDLDTTLDSGLHNGLGY